MKLIIDIPDKDYEFIKDIQTLVIGSRGNCKTLQYNVITAIKNGVPYEERPHGEWVLKEPDYDNDGGNNLYECSICHHYDTHSDSKEVPYCWYCGADMREDADNEVN